MKQTECRQNMTRSRYQKVSETFEIAAVFLRIGAIGFGGPIATMAIMEEECCRKRGWITQEQYNEMYAITKMLPGPVSTQLAIFISKARGGILGGLIGGFVFILPSFALVLAFSMVYAHSGHLAQARPLLNGFQIGALAVIALSVEQMSRSYRKKPHAWAVALLSAVAIFLKPRYEPLIILGFGLVGVFLVGRGASAKLKNAAHALFALPFRQLATDSVTAGAPLAAATPLAAGSQLVIGAPTLGVLGKLFWTCFKAGAFVFGTGLAIVPLLEGDAVQHFHWVTSRQFMDGLAIGQVTPGPVVITVTFLGYIAAGWLGSVIATAGIFLPPFINILLLVPIIWAKWSGKPSSKRFAEWAIPAVIGGIIGTSVRLGLQTVLTREEAVLLVLSLILAFRFKVPAWVVIPVTGAAAYAFL